MKYINPELSKKNAIGLSILAIGVVTVTYSGWRLFWFLTDDAFIAFRYVSNSILGHGYVWNPPPFRPVEGYTSFLWVFLLDVIWRVIGVKPPDVANIVSLLFAYLTLLLGAAMLLKMDLRKRLRKHRMLFMGLVFAGVISNRTFLAWTSSGLETAMFNFFFTLWIFCSLFLPVNSRRWLVGITFASALAYLTRPDGILLAMVTVALVGLAVFARMRRSRLMIGDLAAISPLLAIPVHMAWRWSRYGELLPNTYYAKIISGRIFPESGIRYFLSFAMEYSLWFWIALLIALVFLKPKLSRLRVSRMLLLDIGLEQAICEPDKRIDAFPVSRGVPLGIVTGAVGLSGLVVFVAGRPLWGLSLVGLAVTSYVLLGILNLSLTEGAVVLTLLVHAFYYTVVVGGDHFEFRVYSHLILLSFISFLWLLNAVRIDARSSLLVLLAFIVLSWPIPWAHWSITRNLTTREETAFLKASVAESVQDTFPAAPPFLVNYLRVYDSMQFWLIDRAVGMRHQEHKVFHLSLVRWLPSREEGISLQNEEYPVITATSVGVISWVLPRVNVLDTVGLNDYVIARNPDLDPKKLMAHARRPPPGYLECFAPNVILAGGDVVMNRREQGLTPEKIIDCEQRFADIVASR